MLLLLPAAAAAAAARWARGFAAAAWSLGDSRGI